MLIILLGPPGVGKGTQCERLIQRYHLPVISTGEMLRAAIRQGTDLGRTAAEYIDRGALVPDDLIIDLVRQDIAQNGLDKGRLFDGFPRTLEQAQSLDRMLAEFQRGLDAVISIQADESELKRRLLKRATIEGRRDDNEQTIENRLVTYQRQTAPLIAYYQSQGLLHTVDGLGTPDEVFQRILNSLSGIPRPWKGP